MQNRSTITNIRNTSSSFLSSSTSISTTSMPSPKSEISTMRSPGEQQLPFVGTSIETIDERFPLAVVPEEPPAKEVTQKPKRPSTTRRRSTISHISSNNNVNTIPQYMTPPIATPSTATATTATAVAPTTAATAAATTTTTKSSSSKKDKKEKKEKKKSSSGGLMKRKKKKSPDPSASQQAPTKSCLKRFSKYGVADQPSSSFALEPLNLQSTSSVSATAASPNNGAVVEQQGESPTAAATAAASQQQQEDAKTEKRKSKKKSSKKNKRQTTISWNNKVEKKRHVRVQDLTKEEVESVWYTENDSKIILAIAKVTVKMMMKGEACDDIDFCSRGLEGKTPQGAKRRQKNKLKVRKALLDEQLQQRQNGIYDSLLLADVSKSQSSTMVREAHIQGMNDQHSIKEYMRERIDDYSPVLPMVKRKSGIGRSRRSSMH